MLAKLSDYWRRPAQTHAPAPALTAADERRYKAARTGEDLWSAPQGDADTDTLLDLPELRRRSADAARNNPMALAAITAKTTNVVGTGLRLNASIDREALGLTDAEADAWEARAEAEWALFGESQNSDLRRTLCLADQQELAFRSVLERGDHFVALVTLPAARQGWPFSFALQHIEADRVCNPNNLRDTATLIAGVEKDAGGAPVAYHVSNIHPGAMNRYGRTQQWQRLEAFGGRTGRRLVLHLFRTLRDGQTRGVPDLAPVLGVLKQLDRYVDAEVERAAQSALFLAFVTTQDGEGLAHLGSDAPEVRSDYYRQKRIELDHTSVVGLFPGDQVQFADPKAPNAAADSFLATFSRLMGAALEIPQEVLLRHFSSSYSAARGALLMAWQFFGSRRAWLARELCRPVYEAVLLDAISAGRLSAPGFLTDPFARQAWMGCEWIGDAPPILDENKAVSAAMDRVAAGFSTIKRETAALTGQDYDNVRRQREKERRTDPAALPPAAPTPSAEDLDREDLNS